MPPVRIKNCGLASCIEVDMAMRSGASFIGLVHYPSSPRHQSLEGIATLAGSTGPDIGRVIVTVNPDDALLHAVARMAAISHLQVHGVSDSARLHHMANVSGKKLIIAASIAVKEDLHTAQSLEVHGEHLLLDSKSAGHGGSGASFDWSLLAGAAFKKPWFLAGGLNSENIADALRTTHAPMVDVSSGIESAPGQKSLEKIAAFNAAVLSHSP